MIKHPGSLDAWRVTRGNSSINGGLKSAEDKFLELTGRKPMKDFDRIILKSEKEVLFRKASKSNVPKVEIIDHESKFLEKISFPE